MKLPRFFETVDSFGPLLMRLGLAVVLFPHGAQKVLGWWGGHGFSGTMGYFTGAMHIPAVLAFLAIATEFAAPIALFFGFFTRLAALAVSIHFVVAAILGGHIYNGLFMNWMGNQKGEGFEYHILMVALALGLLFLGGGKWALDRVIARMLYGSPRRAGM
ncbi:MAG: DoxX family protein [Verrucomicrobia bacterium]|nr:DoxX family protein [Verrucomicrobiota bacterium]